MKINSRSETSYATRGPFAKFTIERVKTEITNSAIRPNWFLIRLQSDTMSRDPFFVPIRAGLSQRAIQVLSRKPLNGLDYQRRTVKRILITINRMVDDKRAKLARVNLRSR